MTNRDQDVRRRAFLSATVASVGGLLADRLPSKQLLLDGEPLDDGEQLDQISGAINALRVLDRRDGAASVLMPVSWLADRLVEAIASMPPQHEEYHALATLAADAALLAGGVSFETGENGTALRRYDQAIRAAKKAHDPDLAAYASQARAERVLWRGLKDVDAALAQLKSVELGPVSPQVRGLVHAARGRILASKKNERLMHRAMDDAAEAARSNRSDSPSWLGWCGSPDDIDGACGLALADLGYGDRASELLTSTMRRLPTRMRRLAGTLHRGLAQAAVSTGEPDRAATHVLKAYEVFTATKSRQLGELRVVLVELRSRYGDVRAVRELPDRLRTDTRYVLCRTSDEGTKVHLRSCGYARRGGAHAWPAAEGIEPADLSASPLRKGYSLCVRCLPT